MFRNYWFRFLRTAGTRLLTRGISAMLFYGVAVSPLIAEETLKWQTSTDAAFALAKKENRFVILDLEAVWCHWCHVMEHDTYGNGDVRKKLNEHYVALKIDQDANPDIAARYGDWGWPATIVFAPDGSEIVKRRGFIEPQQMVALLDAIVADPSPGPSVEAASKVEMATTSTLDPERQKELLATYTSLFNRENGGWGDGQRYIDAQAVELAIEQARNRDDAAQQMARQTLDQNLNLLDPVWGGVYQYSVSVDWKSPHFEKIMSFQADDLRLYALAYAAEHEQRYADAANGIFRYLTTNLRSPDGAFYVSQDAVSTRMSMATRTTHWMMAHVARSECRALTSMCIRAKTVGRLSLYAKQTIALAMRKRSTSPSVPHTGSSIIGRCPAADFATMSAIRRARISPTI